MDEARNYPSDEIKHNDLISEKHENRCKYIYFVKHFLV